MSASVTVNPLETAAMAEAVVGGTAVRWERFMPRLAVRVLLVEADDSTRQVVAALLRKCGYRVVAVSDGLEAWELLKGTPYNVDLILTEVELPSISGFALLALAMEHDICKNIPFIMMSSQDSIGTVYKCMLQGAADYLLKPIRRNELQNLWQHVWRRRSLPVDGNLPGDEGVTLQKGEAAAEQNAASNLVNHSTTYTQRDEEFIDKGSDVQSSCTGSNLEMENAFKEQPPKRFFMQQNLNGLGLSSCKFGLSLSVSKEVNQTKELVATGGSGDNHLSTDSNKEAIDLIGAFDDSTRHHCNDYSFHHSAKNLNLSTKLELSLERSDHHTFDNSRSEERHPLKQSRASAFSRYANYSCQLPQKNCGSTERESSNVINDSSSETPSPSLSTPKSILSLPTSWSKLAEPLPPHPRLYPASVPVKVLSFNGPSTDLPLPSPSKDSQQDPSLQVNSFSHFIQEINNREDSTSRRNDQTIYKGQAPGLTFDTFKDRRHCSLSGDRNATSSFTNEPLSQLNDKGRGNTAETGTGVNQSKDEGGSCTLDGVSQQSLQREAALMKFRLKRKVRCFEKKVRYESRKKLAEQRPRVKGQFVRQTNIDLCTEKN